MVVPPRYRGGSIGDVLPGVLAALGAPEPDPIGLAARHPGMRRAVVLLIDGLGYHLLRPMAGVAPTIADVLAGRRGELDRLTTGFPSTTPVSLVTLGTGAAPGAHGVLGFRLRIPGTDRVLTHVHWGDDPDPALWQPVPTAFERARAAGIAGRVVTRPEHIGSGLTVSAYRGAEMVGATDVDELTDGILAAVRSPEPVLVYGYHPRLDTAGHVTGVGSDAWLAEAAAVDALIDGLLRRLPAGTVLFVTGDHGQINVPEDHRFDMDTDARLTDGVAVVAGEARVRYLHVRPGATDDVMAAWRGVLGDAAMVMSRTEAVATGWYGPVAPEHLDRIGDVVVVCRDRYAVVASVRDPGEARLVGFHGGPTAPETEVPLISLRA